VGVSACGGGVPGNAVAQVGGAPITKATYAHWLGVAAAAGAAAQGANAPKPVIPDPPNYTECIAHLQATLPKPTKGQPAPTQAQLKSQCEQQYKALQQEVLGFLISSQWVLAEASNLGVKVTDKEVKSRFEQLQKQQFPKPGQFEKFLQTSGQSVDDLLLRVKLSMLSSKIQQKVVKRKEAVTKAQIAKYYNQNSSRFGSPEKRSVAIVLTKNEAAAKAAKAEIQSGQSFATVAKKVSVDPLSKSNGGLLPEVLKGEEEKTLDSAIFSAKTNVLSGPVKTPFGYYVFEVKSTTPPSHQTLAQSEASIKQQLVATQQQAALTKFVTSFRKKWTAETECLPGYVVANCKEYKAPKTGTTGSTVPAP
jgi:foldase protein PrsA